MEQGILSELRLRVEAIFRTKMYKEACIKRFNHTWDHLYEYMKTKAIEFYSRQTGMDFLNEWHRNKSFNELTHRQQERVRHIEVLTNMLETGTIRRNRHVNKEFVFEGELGKPFNCFIESESHRKRESSLTRYKERINNLYRFLKEEGLTLTTFDVKFALKFIGKLDREKSSPDRDNIVMTTRVFLRFLCDNKLLTNNNSEKWMSLFKIKYIRAKKIPSVYTREEVEAIIESIDKSHPQGKRDYAMILLAARYGLRVSDINGLRFCNLDWEHNKIVLIQQKTQKKVSLPLSEEVGGAIIEYIKFARPSVDLPYVFITAHAPYKELGSNTMTASIADYMRAAGIDSTQKKHGPHSLRHSLATNLLKVNEQLPVISEILGHKTTDSTMTYLRVDTDLLRQCALDVPFVPSTFYEKLYE
jgi:integrase